MTLVLVSEGSSTTEGTTGGVSGTDFAHDSYSELYAQANGSITFHNIATGGAVCSDFVTRAATVDGYLTFPGTNVLVLQPMSNSIDTAGQAQELLDTIAYLKTRRAAGWWIAVVTQAGRTSAGYNTAALSANTSMRAWINLYCDAIIDFGLDAVLSPSSGIDPTYDGVHLTFANQRDRALPIAVAVLTPQFASGRDRRLVKIGS